MDFSLSCRLEYVVEQPSTFLFHFGVDDNPLQMVRQDLVRLEPELPTQVLQTPRGRLHRVVVAEGPLVVTYTAAGQHEPCVVPAAGLSEIPSAEWPVHVLEYLYPSRYCESDLCLDLAYREFGAMDRGYGRVLAICRWIHERLAYESGSSGSTTSAWQTLNAGRGVCRDFAHVGIALCRALNIPARFVSAYAPGLTPPDFHACFEVYLSHRWWLFDPTFMVPRRGIIRIGTGRDAADVSFATILGWVKFGDMELQMEATNLGEDEGLDQAALTIATDVDSRQSR
ncbi:MAG: transglutaminase family protein [Gemmatimonadetes bacterium]|jgi:transglutaminase-like putative cysteine protease|nr:transglutaminase family protein [Gemmatimonadota bacterium]MBT6150034.1 transglutaminase family protein [Gemmatimonadota bacterium]MBT7859502.1 transglutaminase family protein [Gemmatimonadota bacterium]